MEGEEEIVNNTGTSVNESRQNIESESEFNDQMYEDEEDGIEKVDLTNQLIGEVQAFILVLRWMLYEFY